MAKKSAKAKAQESLSFEESLDQLQTIVKDLEDGQLGLEAALARFEQGTHLLKTCFEVLEQAELRVQILTGTGPDAEPELAPFEHEASDRNGQES